MLSAFIILILVSISQSHTKTYISLPFIRTENQTYTAHNVLFDINQYPYKIDITISQEYSYFLKVEDIANIKSKTNNPDFKNNVNTYYGIVDYIASETTDSRLPSYRQIYHNIYFYIKNIHSKSAWINLKDIPQISLIQRKTYLN